MSSVVNSISSTVSRVVSTITMRLPHFATGGFPEDGMFMANNGELVGKFTNGKTAVANNEQIVQGIQSGVYRAVKEAMGESNNNGNNVVQVYIGKKKIAEEVQNANKESTLQLVVLQLAFPLKKILILTWMQKRQEVGKLEY